MNEESASLAPHSAAALSLRQQLVNALLLMRVHFSIFLMPVFWLALWQAPQAATVQTLLVFGILHLLVYPASNGYNCYYDRDTGPIGGLEAPPPPNRLLYFMAWGFDLAALALAWQLNAQFAAMVLVYTLASKAYSHPAIKLKRMLAAGTFTVVFFQGAFTYFMVLAGLGYDLGQALAGHHAFFAATSSLFLLGTYPVSQVFQHEEDAAQGVNTLSLNLGIAGTFKWAVLCSLPAFGLLLLGASFSQQTLQMALGGLLLLVLPYRQVQHIGYLIYHNQPSASFFKPVTQLLAISSLALSGILFLLYLAR